MPNIFANCNAFPVSGSMSELGESCGNLLCIESDELPTGGTRMPGGKTSTCGYGTVFFAFVFLFVAFTDCCRERLFCIDSNAFGKLGFKPYTFGFTTLGREGGMALSIKDRKINDIEKFEENWDETRRESIAR